MTHAPQEPGPGPRIAVVGGGLTGLAAAHRLTELARDSGRPASITLFESTSRVGGIIATERIDGYLVERGADSFITSQPAAIELCRRLGLEQQFLPTNAQWRKSLVLRNGRPLPVPEGFLLLAPAKMSSVLRSPIFSWRGKLRMAWERFVPRKTTDDDESLASFVRRRFGREALERLVQPLVGGIYTSDPEKLSLRATLPRFLDMERNYGSLIRAGRAQASSAETAESGARYGMFLTLREGMQTLFDRLVERVQESASIRFGTRVTALQRLDTGWKIETANGSPETFDAVVLALPAYRSAELCRPFAEQLFDELDGIEYASSAIVVSGHRLEDIRHPLNAFGLVIPEIERRRIIAVSFSSRKFEGRAPEGKVLLRTFVGGAMHPEMMAHTDDELRRIVREELRDILGVAGTPDFEHVARYDRAMPQYHLGHLDRVARIEELTRAERGFAVAGNFARGVGIPNCVQSGEGAAESVWKGVAAHT